MIQHLSVIAFLDLIHWLNIEGIETTMMFIDIKIKQCFDLE